MKYQKLIVLDLDETLIHATKTLLGWHEDYCVGMYFVYQRPHVVDFIDFCFDTFEEVAVWSSSTSAYAEEVCSFLFRDMKQSLAFIWARDRCIYRFDSERYEPNWVKDLNKVKRQGYQLEHVIMVDDSSEKLCRQYGNLVRILPFEGKLPDDELLHLQAYLRILGKVKNVRSVEKRFWREEIKRY